MQHARLLDEILSGDGPPLRPDTAAYLLAFHRELPSPLRLRQLLAADPALLLLAVRIYAQAPREGVPTIEELAEVAAQELFWDRISRCRVLRLERAAQPTLCRVWRYGAASAYWARRLAGFRSHKVGSQAFVAGWVRCAGLYALAIHAPQLWESVRSQSSTPEELLNREQETFGIDHLTLAAQLAAQWGLAVDRYFVHNSDEKPANHHCDPPASPAALAATAAQLTDASAFRLTTLPGRAAPSLNQRDFDAVSHAVATLERLLAEPRRDRADSCDWLQEGAKLAARHLGTVFRDRWLGSLKQLGSERPPLPLAEAVKHLAHAAAVGFGAACGLILETPSEGLWAAHANTSGDVFSAAICQETAPNEELSIPEPFTPQGETQSWTVTGNKWRLRLEVSRTSIVPGESSQGVIHALREALEQYFSERRKLDVEAQLAVERLTFEQRLEERAAEKAWTYLVEMAYGAGHELNNRMGVIAGRAEMLLESEQDEQRRAWLSQIQQEAARVRELLERLYDMADPPDPDLMQIDAQVVLRKAIALAEKRCPDARLRVRIEEPADQLPLWVDPEMAATALAELICNALQHTDEDTDVLVTAEEIDPDRAVVRVRDRGPGLAGRELDIVYVPFYCGKESGRQPGFGLGIARRFIEVQGGRLRIITGSDGTTAEAAFLLRPPSQAMQLRCA